MDVKPKLAATFVVTPRLSASRISPSAAHAIVLVLKSPGCNRVTGTESVGFGILVKMPRWSVEERFATLNAKDGLGVVTRLSKLTLENKYISICIERWRHLCTRDTIENCLSFWSNTFLKYQTTYWHDRKQVAKTRLECTWAAGQLYAGRPPCAALGIHAWYMYEARIHCPATRFHRQSFKLQQMTSSVNPWSTCLLCWQTPESGVIAPSTASQRPLGGMKLL